MALPIAVAYRPLLRQFGWKGSDSEVRLVASEAKNFFGVLRHVRDATGSRRHYDRPILRTTFKSRSVSASRNRSNSGPSM
jgi:hypothetical protein